MADLGPMIGVQTKASGGKPAMSQAETRTRPTAKAKEEAIDPNHILPAGTFDGSRFQKIDAEVSLVALKLVVPKALPLESLRASLSLHDAILKLTQLDFGFAGGTIAAQAVLDARQPTIKSDLQIKLRQVRLDRLVPDSRTIAQGVGHVGGTLQLKGTGNSIADAAAKANGRIAATIANGRISNLVDAASGLHGGKVLQLLVGGDRLITVNCGGMVFDVKSGRGTSTLFVVDTEQTQILGTGDFDLEQERFDITLAPQAEERGRAVAAHSGASARNLQAAGLRDREGPAPCAHRRRARTVRRRAPGGARAADRNRPRRGNELRRRPPRGRGRQGAGQTAGETEVISAGNPATSASKAPQKMRVLVVEDDPGTLALTLSLLETLGHWATGVRSAELAIHRFLEGAFDVLIADIGLPGLSGQDLAEKLQGRCNLPVIFATGQSAPAQLPLRAIWLLKPYSIEQLEEALAQAARLNNEPD